MAEAGSAARGMFPDNWEACKEPPRKRAKGYMERVDEQVFELPRVPGCLVCLVA